MMKNIKILTLTAMFVVTTFQTASAHPGRTAADGCHYCRTNCSSWGVPWNERHCHGNHVDEEQSKLLTFVDHKATHRHDNDSKHDVSSNHVIVK